MGRLPVRLGRLPVCLGRQPEVFTWKKSASIQQKTSLLKFFKNEGVQNGSVRRLDRTLPLGFSMKRLRITTISSNLAKKRRVRHVTHTVCAVTVVSLPLRGCASSFLLSMGSTCTSFHLQAVRISRTFLVLHFAVFFAQPFFEKPFPFNDCWMASARSGVVLSYQKKKRK